MANKQGISAPGQVNMVGQGTVVEGTLRAESDIRISGRVLGNLHVEGKAMVAQEGTIEGELVASNADVAGHIQGEIQVSEQLVLKGSARVDGNIETERLVVEEGALFTGECKMGETTPQHAPTDHGLEGSMEAPDQQEEPVATSNSVDKEEAEAR